MYPESPLLNDRELATSLMDVLLVYIDQVNCIAPRIIVESQPVASEDSQDYGLSDLNNFEREFLVSVSPETTFFSIQKLIQ